MDRADRFWSKISTFVKHPGQHRQHWVSLPFWNHVFNNVDAFQPNGAIQFPNLGGDLRHNWSNTSHLQLLQVQPSKESTICLHILSVSYRALSVFLVKLGAAPLVLVMWSSQPSSSTTATICYSQPSKPTHSPICPASSASLLTTAQRWNYHQKESQSE